MIKLISKELLKAIRTCYQTYKPDNYIDIDETIYKQLSFALIDQSYLSFDEAMTGFAILYPYDKNLVINPWFFGGLPIGEDKSKRLQECLDYFNASEYSRLELIGSKDELSRVELPLPYAYDYANLEKIIFGEHETEGDYIALRDVQESLLKEIYHKAFLNGDAKFYMYQDEDEKKSFWKHLRYDLAVEDPCSIAIKVNHEVIGYVMAYREGSKNRHISCMCVLPEYSGRGYGTSLLEQVFHLASLDGDESITLGTETNMKAYDLYIKTGFRVKDINSYYIKLK